jgi:hypothetical protein
VLRRAAIAYDADPHVNVVTHLDHDQFLVVRIRNIKLALIKPARSPAGDKYLPPKKSVARARGMRAKQRGQKSERNA